MTSPAPPFEQPSGAMLVSGGAFERHCAQAEVLVLKRGMPALLRHVDVAGQPLMTKIWPRRMPWSSELWLPYDQRFRRALQALSALHVPVPDYRAHGRVAGSGLRFVVYQPLAGVPLRDDPSSIDLAHLAAFVDGLHHRGVYFRGLHLGNIVRCPDGALGLIDVQDVRLRGAPLTRNQRERSLGILCSHPRDLDYMLDDRWPELVLAYCRAAGWGVAAAAHMRERVRRQIERRSERRAVRRRRRGRSVEGLAVARTLPRHRS